MSRPGIALVIVSSIACGCGTRAEFSGGTRLTFRYDASGSSSADVLARELAGSIEKRLEVAELSRFRVRSSSESVVFVELPPETPGTEALKDLITREGRFAIHVVVEDEPSDSELDRYESEERAYRVALAESRHRGTESGESHDRAKGSANPEAPMPPGRIVREDADGRRFLLENDAERRVTDGVIEDARSELDAYENPAVAIDFTAEGARKMGALTEAHIGRRLAIVLDGRVLSAPVLQSRIARKALISGSFEGDQVEKMAVLLRSGPLPVPLRFVVETPIEKNREDPGDSGP